MELTKIRTVAKELMEKHGLDNWRFDFSNTRRAIGDASIYQKRIRFSKAFKDLRDDEIIDTILHEIAHALDYKRNGSSSHGPKWKAICREIGAIPKSRKPVSQRPKDKWVSYCEKCGKETGTMNRRGRYTHKNCGGDILFRENT